MICSCLGGLNDKSQFPCLESIRYSRAGSSTGETPCYRAIWESLQLLSNFLQLKLALEEAFHMDAE